MDAFKFVSRYFWLICIGVAVINYLMMNRANTSDETSHIDAGLRRKYLGWFWGLSCVPWLVAGYGQVVGGLPNVWALFRPQDGNPYVWAVYGAVAVIYAVTGYWVLFRDGARITAELRVATFNIPGRSGTMSPFWIKVFAIAALPFLALWLWIASQLNVPIPP